MAFPRDGKAIGNCNCNRRLLPENLSWDRHFSEYLTSVVSCNLPTICAAVLLELRKLRPREVKHVAQCPIVHDQATGPSRLTPLLS